MSIWIPDQPGPTVPGVDVPEVVLSYLRQAPPTAHDDWSCTCRKEAWSDEAGATAALGKGKASGHYADTARTYKCPGSVRWHIASRGFGLDSLKTKARRIAWLLRYEGVLTVDEIAETFGVAWHDRSARRFRREVRVFVAAGLARWETPQERSLVAVDRAGLLRICQIGLREFLAERYGVAASGTRPTRGGRVRIIGQMPNRAEWAVLTRSIEQTGGRVDLGARRRSDGPLREQLERAGWVADGHVTPAGRRAVGREEG